MSPALMPPTSPEQVSPRQEAVLAAIGDVTLLIMNSRFGSVSTQVSDRFTQCMPNPTNQDDILSVQDIANRALVITGDRPVVSKRLSVAFWFG